MIRRLTWEYVRGHKIALAVILSFQVIQTLVGLSLPTLNAEIINRGVVSGDPNLIWKIGAQMLALTVLQGVCLAVAVYQGARLAMGLGKYLRSRMFKQVSAFSLGDVSAFGPATLITRSTNDVQQVQGIAFMTFTIMVVAPIMGVGGVVMAIHQDAQLSLILAVSVPVLALVFGILNSLMRPLFKKRQKLADLVNLRLREQLTGVRVVRAFNRQAYEDIRFDDASSRLRRVSLKTGTIFAFMMPLASFIVGTSSVAVIWFGGIRIDSGGMQIGALVAFISYLMQIMMSVMIAAMLFMMIPLGSVAAGRIAEVIDREPSIHSPANPLTLGKDPVSVVLESVEVTFADAVEPLLSNIDLRVEPGKTVALIGPTGCGKSTIANLFTRLIDPSTGTVSFEQAGNSYNLKQLSLVDLRERVALVPQKAYLFKGTIASNVANLPVSEVTTQIRAQVQTALEVACADEFVSSYAAGVDQDVDPGGVGFSGGQRQRLTIARAVYKMLYGQANVLIIDDAFSALDLITDAKIRKNLQKTLPNAACLVIAQRVSSIADANEILVMENGQVVDRGTHTQLLQKSALYQEISASQLQEVEAK